MQRAAATRNRLEAIRRRGGPLPGGEGPANGRLDGESGIVYSIAPAPKSYPAGRIWRKTPPPQERLGYELELSSGQRSPPRTSPLGREIDRAERLNDRAARLQRAAGGEHPPGGQQGEEEVEGAAHEARLNALLAGEWRGGSDSGDEVGSGGAAAVDLDGLDGLDAMSEDAAGSAALLARAKELFDALDAEYAYKSIQARTHTHTNALAHSHHTRPTRGLHDSCHTYRRPSSAPF